MRRFIFLFALTLPLTLNAQTLTLKDAVSEGLKQSYTVQISRQTAVSAKYLTDAADSKFDPALSASLSAQRNDEPTVYVPYNMDYLRQKTYEGRASLTKLHRSGMTGEFQLKTMRLETNDPYEDLDPRYSTVFLMNITQPLLKNAGKDVNGYDVKNSELTAQQAQYDLYGRMIDTAAQIEAAYFGLVKAQDIYGLTKASKQLARSLLDYDQKRFKAGIIPVTEVQQAMTALSGRQEREVSAEDAVRQAKITLENLMNSGSEIDQVQTAETSMALPDTDTGYKTALGIRPDLEKLRIELKKQDVTINYLANQEKPELDLKATLGASGLSGDGDSANHFDGEYYDSVFDMTNGEGLQWLVGVNLNYPLGQRGAKARTAYARSEKLASVYKLKKAESDVKKDIRTAVSAIDGAMKRYEIAKTFISLAETTLSQEMRKMDEGLSDTFRIISFQDDLLDAKIRAANALYDYRASQARFYQATGENLDRLGFKLGE